VKHHRRRRRLHPARLLRWFLELPEEERLEEYGRRWRSFKAACETFGEVLARAVETLVRAEAALLGVDLPLTPAEREARALALGVRLIARYWRRRPCPAFGGRCLPKIATGPYFEAGADSVHWLDLDGKLIREALAQELAALDRRLNAAGRPDGLDLLLLDSVRDRLLADPVRAVGAPLVHRVRAELTALAHDATALVTRRRAAKWLERLDRTIRPDFRARAHRCRAHHNRLSPRSRALLKLADAVQEEQETFRTWCATVNRATLPPPLRAPATV
jgi:hypothetical protein